MIEIGVVDNHPVVRLALRHFLQTHDDIRVVGEAKDAFGAIDLARIAQPNMLILDLDLPGRSGIDVLAMLRRQAPKMSVIVFTNYPEEQYAFRLLQMGASAFIPKHSELDVLIKAIRMIEAGTRWISHDQLELMVDASVTQYQQPYEVLTAREFQVLLKLARGIELAEIAKALSLSLRSIVSYRSRLRSKLQLSSNSEITYYALKHKLLE